MGMGLYQTAVLPRLIDVAMRGDDLNRLRAGLLARARGRTLEVGFGTGLNARHYPKGIDLVVVDDNPGMNTLATRRLQQAGLHARHEVLSGESLPFADGSFDTVVVTFTLCSINDVASALREMRRVLAPAGQLLFLEHGLADDERSRRWQHVLNPLWQPVAGGCHLDRDTGALLRAAGFDVEMQGQTLLSVGAVLGTVRWGIARHPSRETTATSADP